LEPRPADQGNGITPLRLILALLVVVSHAWPAGDFGNDVLFEATGEGVAIGTVAVAGFFGLSGFLLAKSRLTSSLGRYVRRRALRILPGLWVCLAVVGFIAIPLALAMGGRATPDQVLQFVGSAATFQPFPATIPGLYPGSGEPSLVNVPLWTLSWEVYLYAVLAVLGLGGRASMRVLCPVLLAAAVMVDLSLNGSRLELYGHLPVAFLTGACVYLFGVPIRRGLAAIAAIALLVAAVVGWLEIVSPAAVAYLALWVGLRNPLRWTLDLSFGVYIYGWPIQSLLAVAGVAALGLLPYLALSSIPILLVAYLSARFVERPFLVARPFGPLRTVLERRPSSPEAEPARAEAAPVSPAPATPAVAPSTTALARATIPAILHPPEGPRG
jgi:peptidoglycan/LPS O-acetylase OafA/YrhL